MKKYYAVQFGTPSAFQDSNNAPVGSILRSMYAEKTPNRQRVQNKEENSGFRGYLRVVQAVTLEAKYTIQGDYIYEK